MIIIAFGDIHMQPERAREIPGIKDADCVVITGDLTLYGGRKEAGSVLETISDLNAKLYAHIGNMDKGEVDVMFTEMGINLNGRGVPMGEVGLFGLGGSNPTPFETPSEFSEEELGRRLWRAYEEVKEVRFQVLISHTPPFNTRLDRIRGGQHVGSLAVRNFLENTHCAACICGHIHESVGTDKLGSTVLINPGMLAQGGYVRIESEGERFVASLEQC
jgi:Icc-related predicted phosphoesterase